MKNKDKKIEPHYTIKSEDIAVIKELNYNTKYKITEQLSLDDPQTFEIGDSVYKIYRLKQKTRSVPPSGGNGGKKNPKDPYVKRSELRAELKALENRIEIKFDKKLDAFKKETRKEFDKTKKEIAETKKEITETKKEIASVKIEMNSKFDEVNAKFDEVKTDVNEIKGALAIILKKLNFNK